MILFIVQIVALYLQNILIFDEFMKHIVGSNNDFAVSIAIFKVSCKKKADKIMKLNRFFS